MICEAETQQDRQVQIQLQYIKDTLYYMDVIEIHESNFAHDMYGDNDSPAAIDQDISAGPWPSPPTEPEITEYLLPPSLSCYVLNNVPSFIVNLWLTEGICRVFYMHLQYAS